MLEVNAIYFILLVEGFLLLLVLLLISALIALVRKRRNRRYMAELEARVRDRSQQRGEQTKSFLQAAYHLEGEDLNSALVNIDQHEIDFFQYLADALARGDYTRLATIDTSLDKLIESYKCLLPHEQAIPREEPEVMQEINTLRGENETLRDELSVAKNKLNDTITEFADMFGGGRDHQLALHEVVEKIDAMIADNNHGKPLRVQK